MIPFKLHRRLDHDKSSLANDTIPTDENEAYIFLSRKCAR